MADELKQKKGSDLPIADALSDNDSLFGIQAGVTKRFPGSQVRAQQFLSVKDYGDLNGAPTVAFQAAYDAAPAGGRILVPAPGPYNVGTLTGTKSVTWEILFDINTNLALLNLPGRVIGGFASAGMVRRNRSDGSEFATIRLDRVADYAGGSSGQVCANLRATTSVTNNSAASFEWGGLFIMDNAGRGENVAVYGQGNRRAESSVTIGGTFASCFESKDFTQEANPTTGLIACELDTFANGTDSVGRRVTLDIVIGKGVASGATCEALAAIRIGPQAGEVTNGRYKNGFLMTGSKDYGVRISGPTVENVIDLAPTSSKIGVKVGGLSSDAGFVHDGTAPYGMRFSGSYSSAAIRMPENVGIAFESTGSIQQKYNGGALEFRNTGILRTSFSMATGAMSIGGTQVVGPRDTGWAPMTGTANKNTSYDVSTVTLLQLAGRMKAIQDLLSNAHGLSGA